jgi:hypothetical protein
MERIRCSLSACKISVTISLRNSKIFYIQNAIIIQKLNLHKISPSGVSILISVMEIKQSFGGWIERHRKI